MQIESTKGEVHSAWEDSGIPFIRAARLGVGKLTSKKKNVPAALEMSFLIKSLVNLILFIYFQTANAILMVQQLWNVVKTMVHALALKDMLE